MTSRERILASIEHREPDMLPLDLGSNVSAGISGQAYGRIREHLGMTGGHNRIYDVVQQVAVPEIEFLDRIGADALDVARFFCEEDADWYDVTLSGGIPAQWPVWFKPVVYDDGSQEYFDAEGTKIARMPSEGMCFDQCTYPYIDGFPEDFSNIERDMQKVIWAACGGPPWGLAGDAYWEALRDKCAEARKTSDRAFVFTAGCNFFEWGSFLRRMDVFLMDIHRDKKKVMELNEKLLELHLQKLEKVCTHLDGLVDVVVVGDDLGMTNNTFFSPKTYREMFKPFHTKLCEYVHGHSSIKMRLHSCGSVYTLIGDFIDAGFDILNPVQISAAKMDPRVLKQEFGKDITFWGGGCNTSGVLNRGTPEEVYRHVRETIDIFYRDGGFIFNQVHNILGDCSPENIMAMYRAVEDARK